LLQLLDGYVPLVLSCRDATGGEAEPGVVGLACLLPMVPTRDRPANIDPRVPRTTSVTLGTTVGEFGAGLAALLPFPLVVLGELESCFGGSPESRLSSSRISTARCRMIPMSMWEGKC
jgi:hypothetical protein